MLGSILCLSSAAANNLSINDQSLRAAPRARPSRRPANCHTGPPLFSILELEANPSTLLVRSVWYRGKEFFGLGMLCSLSKRYERLQEHAPPGGWRNVLPDLPDCWHFGGCLRPGVVCHSRHRRRRSRCWTWLCVQPLPTPLLRLPVQGESRGNESVSFHESLAFSVFPVTCSMTASLWHCSLECCSAGKVKTGGGEEILQNLVENLRRKRRRAKGM